LPAAQVAPLAQVVAQAPQCASSLCKSTQPLPQLTRPAGQDGEQSSPLIPASSSAAQIDGTLHTLLPMRRLSPRAHPPRARRW
jgi:hypothetical protein